MGRKKKSSSSSKKLDTEDLTNYFKWVATFQCSKVECQKIWTSVHGWGNEDECKSNCEVCNEPAVLTGARDEKLTKDTYKCPKQDCKESWEVIHSEKDELLEECNSCGTSTSPKRSDNTNGRRYTFKCKNENCKEKPEWKEFSLNMQKVQRCGKKVKTSIGGGVIWIYCGNAGILVNIKKKQIFPRSTNNEVDNNGGKGTHNADLCDMCRLCKKDGYRTCHKYRKAMTKMQNDQGDGEKEEKIISIK